MGSNSRLIEAKLIAVKVSFTVVSGVLCRYALMMDELR